MKKWVVILFFCCLDFFLSFADNLYTDYIGELSRSVGFLFFYSLLWLRMSIMLFLMNYFLYPHLNKEMRVVVIFYSAFTQYLFFGWIYGQYLQLLTKV